jgi:RNA recognition motif-containing protein
MTESKSPISGNSPAAQVEDADESKKIFVGNLPFDVLDEELAAFFQAVGKV